MIEACGPIDKTAKLKNGHTSNYAKAGTIG
jgi:hypothetical protein